ncbi:hypothetical protein [Reichenbachiella versicolor]|uniref:hypothetical protein n=1 Tax=Reichenbachiella versicolor TaxID=1821036 RepID=UPI000D6E9FFA|nr:hypothetical protein [Reichenbachiella versicolor]
MKINRLKRKINLTLLTFILSFSALFYSCDDTCECEEIQKALTTELDNDSQESDLQISFKEGETIANEKSGTILIPLKLVGTSTEEVSVTYQATGTADFIKDVTPLTSTTFVIPKGATAYNVEMLIVEDGVRELENETLTLEIISVSSGGSIGARNKHDLTITPLEPIVVGFNKSSISKDCGARWIPRNDWRVSGWGIEYTINLSQESPKDIYLIIRSENSLSGMHYNPHQESWYDSDYTSDYSTGLFTNEYTIESGIIEGQLRTYTTVSCDDDPFSDKMQLLEVGFKYEPVDDINIEIDENFKTLSIYSPESESEFEPEPSPEL